MGQSWWWWWWWCTWFRRSSSSSSCTSAEVWKFSAPTTPKLWRQTKLVVDCVDYDCSTLSACLPACLLLPGWQLQKFEFWVKNLNQLVTTICGRQCCSSCEHTLCMHTDTQLENRPPDLPTIGCHFLPRLTHRVSWCFKLIIIVSAPDECDSVN